MKRFLIILFVTILTGTTFGQKENNRFQFLIEQCSPINSENYKCTPYLSLAGYIQSLDRTKAIEILKENAGTNKYEGQIIILSRILFRGRGNAVLRRPLIGGAGFIGNTGYKDWPSEPIEIINGIPFLITRGYSLGGKAESSLKYLEYCIANGQWTNNNYSSIKREDLKPALKILLNNKKWQTELTKSEKAFFERQIDTTLFNYPEQNDIITLNNLNKYSSTNISREDEKILQDSLKSNSLVIRSFCSAILYKKNQKKYREDFYGCFTVNDYDSRSNGEYNMIQQTDMLNTVKAIEDNGKILEEKSYNLLLCYCWYRDRNEWIQTDNQKMSISRFFRGAFLGSNFKETNIDVLSLANKLDKEAQDNYHNRKK